MYGIVNNAVKDLVLSIAGQEVWVAILDAAGCPGVNIEDTVRYDDELTLKVAAAACEHFDMSLEVLLHTFGKHWVLYTDKQGWAHHFMLPADSFLGVLAGLDEVHARVKDAMPDGEMPFFALSGEGDDYLLEYHSTREGFAPMVLGILEGLAEKFGGNWQCEHIGSKQEWSFDKFALKRLSEDYGSEPRRAA